MNLIGSSYQLYKIDFIFKSICKYKIMEMWKPKYDNLDMFIGKDAIVYYNDKYRTGSTKDKVYESGKILKIRQSQLSPNIYTVQIDNNSQCPVSIASGIIKKVEVKMFEFEINNEIKKMCNKYLVNDMSYIISEYVDPLII